MGATDQARPTMVAPLPPVQDLSDAHLAILAQRFPYRANQGVLSRLSNSVLHAR